MFRVAMVTIALFATGFAQEVLDDQESEEMFVLAEEFAEEEEAVADLGVEVVDNCCESSETEE